MKINQPFTGIAVIVLSVFILMPGCKISKQYKGDIEKITIADASQPVFAIIYIADANGYLADEGLEVTYNSFTSGRDALASVIDGNSDIATVFETPVVLKTFEGRNLNIITEMHHSTRNTALVARKDKGISVPGDLKGKTIAVSKNTSGEFFLFLFLTSEGLRLTDVNFVDTKPEDMADVLKDEKVDAVATWNPNLFNVKKEFKPVEIVTFISSEYTETSVLAGKSEFIKGRPEAMKRLLKGLLRAEQYMKQHEKEDILPIIFNRLNHQSEKNIRNTWNDFHSELRISNILLTILTEEAQWFIDNKQIEKPLPDFREVLFTDYLKEVKPETVTVF